MIHFLKSYEFVQVSEKQVEHDRLAAELTSLKKLEKTQMDFFEQFALQK